MRNKLLLLLLVTVSLGLKAQTDMFPDYTPESYDIALDYKAGEIKMFNVHAPNNICNSYMYYNVYGLKPTVGNRWIKSKNFCIIFNFKKDLSTAFDTMFSLYSINKLRINRFI